MRACTKAAAHCRVGLFFWTCDRGAKSAQRRITFLIILSHSIVYFKIQLIVSMAAAGSPIADLASSYAAASAP